MSLRISISKSCRKAVKPTMNKALFLDRDGIINVDHGYVYQSENFNFAPEIFDLCHRFVAQNYVLVVVTNQSGIARGLYSEADFTRLTEWMTTRFKEQGIDIAGVYHCPHHPSKGLDEYRIQCSCRKPMPGMLVQAAQELKLDLSQSIIVGDKLSDAMAGKQAGTKRQILLMSDYLQKENIPSAFERVSCLNEINP
jgi:D-glycero-D-manno-heptose 1,7-bisphosphate phosphatase